MQVQTEKAVTHTWLLHPRRNVLLVEKVRPLSTALLGTLHVLPQDPTLPRHPHTLPPGSHTLCLSSLHTFFPSTYTHFDHGYIRIVAVYQKNLFDPCRSTSGQTQRVRSTQLYATLTLSRPSDDWYTPPNLLCTSTALRLQKSKELTTKGKTLAKKPLRKVSKSCKN